MSKVSSGRLRAPSLSADNHLRTSGGRGEASRRRGGGRSGGCSQKAGRRRGAKCPSEAKRARASTGFGTSSRKAETRGRSRGSPGRREGCEATTQYWWWSLASDQGYWSVDTNDTCVRDTSSSVTCRWCPTHAWECVSSPRSPIHRLCYTTGGRFAFTTSCWRWWTPTAFRCQGWWMARAGRRQSSCRERCRWPDWRERQPCTDLVAAGEDPERESTAGGERRRLPASQECLETQIPSGW